MIGIYHTVNIRHASCMTVTLGIRQNVSEAEQALKHLQEWGLLLA